MFFFIFELTKSKHRKFAIQTNTVVFGSRSFVKQTVDLNGIAQCEFTPWNHVNTGHIHVQCSIFGVQCQSGCQYALNTIRVPNNAIRRWAYLSSWYLLIAGVYLREKQSWTVRETKILRTHSHAHTREFATQLSRSLCTYSVRATTEGHFCTGRQRRGVRVSNCTYTISRRLHGNVETHALPTIVSYCRRSVTRGERVRTMAIPIEAFVCMQYAYELHVTDGAVRRKS